MYINWILMRGLEFLVKIEQVSIDFWFNISISTQFILMTNFGFWEDNKYLIPWNNIIQFSFGWWFCNSISVWFFKDCWHNSKKEDSIRPIQNRFLWHPRYNSRFACNCILDVSWPSMQLPLSSCTSIFDKCPDLHLCANCACGQSSPHLLLHLWFIEWYQHWSHASPTSYSICNK